jgi:uncharacterized membrane protein
MVISTYSESLVQSYFQEENISFSTTKLNHVLQFIAQNFFPSYSKRATSTIALEKVNSVKYDHLCKNLNAIT